ncbi:hypothetical protein VCR4J2_240097 [Vibrio coralliirubri]|nr:hypothetical protein VCR4J2_240097 [Vibrio coralliirubri]
MWPLEIKENWLFIQLAFYNLLPVIRLFTNTINYLRLRKHVNDLMTEANN